MAKEGEVTIGGRIFSCQVQEGGDRVACKSNDDGNLVQLRLIEGSKLYSTVMSMLANGDSEKAELSIVSEVNADK